MAHFKHFSFKRPFLVGLCELGFNQGRHDAFGCCFSSESLHLEWPLPPRVFQSRNLRTKQDRLEKINQVIQFCLHESEGDPITTIRSIDSHGESYPTVR